MLAMLAITIQFTQSYLSFPPSTHSLFIPISKSKEIAKTTWILLLYLPQGLLLRYTLSSGYGLQNRSFYPRVRRPLPRHPVGRNQTFKPSAGLCVLFIKKKRNSVHSNKQDQPVAMVTSRVFVLYSFLFSLRISEEENKSVSSQP